MLQSVVAPDQVGVAVVYRSVEKVFVIFDQFPVDMRPFCFVCSGTVKTSQRTLENLLLWLLHLGKSLHEVGSSLHDLFNYLPLIINFS